jgi:hypothetical protein
MKIIYTATTCRFNSHGEISEEVQDFTKDRSGLRQAYEFVQGADEWIIWCGDEMVDYAK